MSEQERNHLIEWLSVWTNYNRDYFKDWTDEQLVNFYNEQMEKWSS
jgi:hypothetical protein